MKHIKITVYILIDIHENYEKVQTSCDGNNSEKTRRHLSNFTVYKNKNFADSNEIIFKRKNIKN